MSTKNLPKWKRKLSATDRRHLAEFGIKSLRGMKTCAEFQAGVRRDHPEYSEPCGACRSIANKLGLPI